MSKLTHKQDRDRLDLGPYRAVLRVPVPEVPSWTQPNAKRASVSTKHAEVFGWYTVFLVWYTVGDTATLVTSEDKKSQIDVGGREIDVEVSCTPHHRRRRYRRPHWLG